MQHICLNQLCRATVVNCIRLKSTAPILAYKIYGPSVFHSIRSKSTAQVLAYKIYGPSPTPKNIPIIVLHDCVATKKNWESICKKLNVLCKKSVIAVDARNHGDSPYCKTHDYKSLAADVSKLLISQFELEKCIMIGHSMGGRTAMLVALNNPSRVASLVVVDISPVSTSSYIELTLPKLIDVLMSVDFKGLTLKDAKAVAKEKIVESKLFEHEAEVDAILMNIEQLNENTIGWKFNLDVLKKRMENIANFPLGWKTFQGPTLFLAGKLSFCIPTDDLSRIQCYFPAARLLYIDEVGHNLHIEDPDGLVAAILRFFDFNALIKSEPVT